MYDIIIPTNKNIDQLYSMICAIKNTAPECRVIATCQPLSAAQNRNYGLECANTDIIIMIDDDISNFYKGWTDDIAKPFVDKDVMLSSARLVNMNGAPQPAMGMDNMTYDEIQYVKGKVYNGVEYKRVATAAITIRKTDIRFNEKFIKSGYEDTSYMNSLCEKYPNCKFAIVNKCRLMHANAMQGQEDIEAWRHNKNLYCSLYPWDEVAQNQKAWHPAIRGQQ